MIPICHVQVLPIMSGVQRSMLEILRHLDREIFDPHVVCHAEGPMTDELRRRDIRYHIVPELQRAIRPWHDLGAYRKLQKLFAREKFQLVHNQSAKPRAVAGLAAHSVGVPVIVNHVRGYPFHPGTPWLVRKIYRQVEAFAARRSTATLFVNHEDHRMAVNERLVPADRGYTVYNGADLAAFSPEDVHDSSQAFRQSYGIDPDEVVITVLGRLDRQKQPLILPRIAAELDARQLDRPWRIIVAGDGVLRPALEESIADHRLWHRFLLVGWQSRPSDVLHASDVLLLPSLWEGLPRVLIEAHAAGCPCVASNIRGNREAIGEDTGYLVQSDDVVGYATSLASLIADPFHRRRLGVSARRRAEVHFDTAKNSQRIVELYHQWLGIERVAPSVRPEAA